jgi:hypothetical protein
VVPTDRLPLPPRCPVAGEICSRQEPALLGVGANTDHVSACHFRSRVASADALTRLDNGRRPAFGAVTGDNTGADAPKDL